MATALGSIYTTLFDNILQGEYKSGDRLKEDDLAKTFRTSRTPVREALRVLAQDGLVELTPNRGAVVVGFTVDDVEEIYEIRKSLEAQAVRVAAPLLSINGLKTLREDILRSGDSADSATHEALDARLHEYFINASGKRRLIRILSQMRRLVRRFRDIGYQDAAIRATALKDHVEIIDALTLRNAEEAVAILDRHLEWAKRNAISVTVRGERR